jgi:hypothetical protein
VRDQPATYGLRDYGDPRQLGSEETLGNTLNASLQSAGRSAGALRDDGYLLVEPGIHTTTIAPGRTTAVQAVDFGQKFSEVENCPKRGEHSEWIQGERSDDPALAVPLPCTMAGYCVTRSSEQAQPDAGVGDRPHHQDP